MIYLLSSDIGQYDRFLLDNWAFAGTIVSIILAVIAILYTFDQSSTTVASTKKLEESANRVEEATKELENSNIDTIITDLEKRMTVMLQEMQQGINDNISTNLEPFTSLLNVQNNVISIDKGIEILNKDEWKEYIKNTIAGGINIEGITLGYSWFLYKNDLKYTLKKTIEWVEKSLNDSDSTQAEIMSNLIRGQMRVYQSFNIFSYESNDSTNSGKFTYFNQNVFDEIKKLMEGGDEDFKKLNMELKDFFKI